MSLILFVMTVPATHAMLQTWFTGSVFEGWRARIESWRDWRSELLGCRFCLAHWVTFVLTILNFVVTATEPRDWLLLPLYWFAALEAVQLYNKDNGTKKEKPDRP